VIGDGPAMHGLTALAVALGIGDRVRFTGHIADREPYLAALAATDLFVSASPAEGFPKAVLDAMAVGLPVVAVPAGQLAELTGSDATSAGPAIHPVPAGDPSALAEAILGLRADPARAARLRAAGRAFVSAHTMPAEAGRLARVLVAAAAGRSRGRVRRR
jgi:glycosyltransferase involved in cell wall biosynthesis